MREGRSTSSDELTERSLPSFEELEELDDVSGPLYTETIDFGKLRGEDISLGHVAPKSKSLPGQLLKLLDALPTPAILVDRSYSIMYLNESCGKLSDSYKNLLHTSFISLFPREREAVRAAGLVDRVFVYRKRQFIEGLMCVEGHNKWCRVNMRSIRFGDDRAMLGLVEDLTLVKKQLIVDKKRKKALQQAHDQLEKRVEERTKELRLINKRLHREVVERKKIEQELREAQADLERRVDERTVELRQTNEKLLLEISERKRAQEKLVLDAKIIETCDEAILITDEEGTVIDLNKSFCDVTGFSPQDLIGVHISTLKSSDRSPNSWQRIWRAVVSEGRWQGEAWNIRKDGEVHPILLSMGSVRNDLQQPTHYFAIFSDITQLKKTEERLQDLAHRDPLTGLPNRALYRERLDAALLDALEGGHQVALMIVDLDRFKNVNDTFGHKVGDELLVNAGKRLRNCVRESDTVARLGGDEFTVILRKIRGVEDAGAVAANIVRVFSRPFSLEGRELFVSASVGITIYPNDAVNADRLLQSADAALYQAKHQGRQNFQFYSEEMNLRILEKLELELDLRAALERDEFVLYYQPVMHFDTERIMSVEALLRWNHPRRGMIQPSKIIPLAEETGLIVPIGEWVLRSACLQSLAWRDMGLPDFPVSVNVSGRQLREPDFADRVDAILTETGFDPALLELELTETMPGPDEQTKLEQLHRLRRWGVRLCIDDFGTAYSSLSNLKRVPLSKLKIDRSFVSDAPDDPGDASIVKAVVAMARGLGIEVVAEGIETVAHLHCLRSIGCDGWQGYLLTKPLPVDAFCEMVVSSRLLPLNDGPRNESRSRLQLQDMFDGPSFQVPQRSVPRTSLPSSFGAGFSLGRGRDFS